MPPSSDDAVLVEFLERARHAEALQIVGRGEDVEMHREQLALDEVGLGRRRSRIATSASRIARSSSSSVVISVTRMSGIEVEEFTEPRREPDEPSPTVVVTELAGRPLAAVGELGARGLELHEHFVRGAIQQSPCSVRIRPRAWRWNSATLSSLLERAHLPRHRRLRGPSCVARMGEAAGFGGGVKYRSLSQSMTLQAQPALSPPL